MKAMIVALAITAVLVCASGYAVPPAYEGKFGNPEEPALRVIKWPWLGFKKFVGSTHEGLKSGMDKESLSATGQDGATGAVKGAGTFVDHTAKGLIYAPLPDKESLNKTVTYEDRAMAYIEKMTKSASGEQTEAADGCAETSACCSEDAVSQDEGIKEVKEEKYLSSKIEESDVEKAQRRYVPLRASARDRVWSGGGNLLKLAR